MNDYDQVAAPMYNSFNTEESYIEDYTLCPGKNGN